MRNLIQIWILPGASEFLWWYPVLLESESKCGGRGLIVSCSCRLTNEQVNLLTQFGNWRSKIVSIWKFRENSFLASSWVGGFVVEPEKLCISNSLSGDAVGPRTTLWAAGVKHLGFFFFFAQEKMDYNHFSSNEYSVHKYQIYALLLCLPAFLKTL